MLFAWIEWRETGRVERCHEETKTNTPTNRNDKPNTSRKVIGSAVFLKRRLKSEPGPPSTQYITAAKSRVVEVTVNPKTTSQCGRAAKKEVGGNFPLLDC
jgi:hypothetical protein